MNTTWKPHTKKPSESSQKSRVPSASRSAAPAPGPAGPTCAGGGASRMPKASGSTRSASSESATSAPCQSSHAISPRLAGSMTNWPNEPTAIVMPIARLRRSGATSRLSVPNTTGKVVPERPSPIRTPAPRMKVASPATFDISHSPAP